MVSIINYCGTTQPFLFFVNINLIITSFVQLTMSVSISSNYSIRLKKLCTSAILLYWIPISSRCILYVVERVFILVHLYRTKKETFVHLINFVCVIEFFYRVLSDVILSVFSFTRIIEYTNNGGNSLEPEQLFLYSVNNFLLSQMNNNRSRKKFVHTNKMKC